MAGSATVGILRVLLTADTAQYDAALRKASQGADALAKDFNSIGRQATAVGAALTKALTVPLVGLAAASVKSAIDFESSFSNVAKTVDGVSDKFGKLTPVGQALAMTFRNMAKEIPVTTNELTKIAALGGQMGVPIQQLEHFTKNVAALGIAVDGISTEEAASGLAAIGNAVGQGTTKVAEMASALVHLGNNANATEGEILEFTKRLVGAGHAVGMTVPEVMGLGAAMANVGINAEAGGTAMSTVITKISKAVSTGGQALEEFARVAGKSAEDFAAIWKRSPIEAMDLFIKGLGRLKKEGADLNLTMGETGTEGIRVADTLKRLSGATQSVADTTKLANEGYSAANKHLEEAQKKYATTEKQLTLLWNRIKDVGITLGNALLPAINASIKGIEGLLPVVDTLAKMFAALPGGAQAIVIGMGLVVAAIGPAVYIFGQMALSVSSLIGLFGKKGIATRALAGDYAFLSGAAGTATGALGLLSKAASVAAAAFVGWQIGRLIADLTGLDQKIADSITGIENLARSRQLMAQGKQAESEAAVQSKIVELTKQRTEALWRLDAVGAALLSQQIDALKNDQTRLAMQDSINAAIRRGAASTITYADAIKYNEEWLKKQQAAQQAAADGIARTGDAAGKAAPQLSMLAQLTAQYANDLKKIGTSGFKEIQKAHEDFGVSIKDLSEKYHVAESSIDKYIASTRGAAKATKESAKDLKEVESVLDEIAKSSENFTKAIQKQDEAFDKTVKDIVDSANKEALKIVQGWQKAGEDAGQKLAEGLAKSNKNFLDDSADLQKQLISGEKDSLDKRLKLIHLDFDERRRSLDKTGTLYEMQLAALNADEAQALEDGTRKWNSELATRADAYAEFGKAIQQVSHAVSGYAGELLGVFGGIISGQAALSKATTAFNDKTTHDVNELTGKLKHSTAESVQYYSQAAMSIVGYYTTAIAIIEKAYDSLTGKEANAAILQRGGDAAITASAATAGQPHLADAVLNARRATEFRMALEALDQAVAANNERLQRYGLTWRDLGENVKKANISAMTTQLVKDGRAFYMMGLDFNQQVKAMSSGLNQLIIDATTTGQKIPKALEPMLQTLIRSGQLSEDAARAMLGMAPKVVVAFKDIEEAAKRYGIEVGKLGPAIQQIKINDIAKQIIADWTLLQSAGADTNAVLAGMQDEVQEVVSEALKAGLKIPAAMKPIIEALIAAGLLTDEFGNKLENTSGIEFEKPLTDAIDELIKKLDELIDHFSTVGDNAERMGNRIANAVSEGGKAVPRGQEPTTGASGTPPPSGPSSPGDTTGTGDTTTGPPSGHQPLPTPTTPGRRYATGGIVGRVLQFPTPKGSDNIPVLASEGEGWLNVPAMRIVGKSRLDALNRGVSVSDVEGRMAPHVGDSAPVSTVVYETHHHHEWHAIDENSVRQFVRRSDFKSEVADQMRTDGNMKSAIKRTVA